MIKEILSLHSKGFVLLAASKTKNSPIGWKRKQGKTKYGYIEEMQDEALKVYRETFDPKLILMSHCGFYLGHNKLCCIDLDTKHTTIENTTKVKNSLVKTLGKKVAVETTKSQGFHIYFRYGVLDTLSNFTGLGKENWIELYYSKRFVACYLSSSKQYKLIHGNVADLPLLSKGEHAALLRVLEPYKGKEAKRTKAKKRAPVDLDTTKQVESYVEQIVARGLDITGDNTKWFKIGKALANAFGEKGFEYFNQVSQFSLSYNPDQIPEDYNRFLEDDKKERKVKITIATFFKICEDEGLYDLSTVSFAAAKEANVEYEIPIVKKDPLAEKVHMVIAHFTSVVPIVTLDRKSFYTFHQTHWVRKNERQILELVHSFILKSDVAPEIVRQLSTLPALENMLKELSLRTMVDDLIPDTGDLSSGVNVNMQNGVMHINLKNGDRKLLDHEARYKFTGVLPFDYMPQSSCPKFDAWLKERVPDPEQQIAYYAFVASCLTKHKSDIIMMLAGPTSTGKSSLIDVTRRLIGLNNTVAISAGMLFGGGMDAQVQAMQMENKMLAYDFDAQPFKSLEMLLKVAAQEPLQGWQMNVARRPVVNYGRVIIAMNPYNYSIFTSAVARRFVTINMDIPVVKDNTVMPAIYEHELSGILNNVLNIGMKHLIEHGGQINVTQKMKRATTAFHMGGRDSVRWFKQYYEVPLKASTRTTIGKHSEKIIEANLGKNLIRTSISELYRQYRIWCEDVEGFNTSKIQLRKHFAQDLELIDIRDNKEAEFNTLCVYVIKKEDATD